MIQEIAPMILNNQYEPRVPKDSDCVICFCGNSKKDDQILLLSGAETIAFPSVANLDVCEDELRFLFAIDDVAYFMYDSKDLKQGLVDLPEGYGYEPIRVLRRNNPQVNCFAGMTAYHLFVWYRDNRFCGQCGSPTDHDEKLRMVKCPHCGNMIFPKIAPAVIIGVIKDDEILISHYAGREYKGRALLAGFCEIGETPEETVAREVLEEVGLKVKNIRYYKSQPWGFDSNLLLGYFCELDGDAVMKLDEEELASARFVKREEIEPDPNLFSLTATMIEEFRTGKYNL